MRPEDAAARALAAILPTLARPEETQPADARLRAFFREHPSLGRRERIQAADLVFDVLRNLRLYRVLATGDERAQEAPPERLVAQARAALAGEPAVATLAQLPEPVRFSLPDWLAEIPERWTADHRLRGRAWLACRFRWDATAFRTGVPKVTAVVRGRQVFDPRTGRVAWSANSALCAADWLTSYRGIPRERINLIDWIAAANLCDEPVPVRAGGSERRYETHGTLATDDDPRVVLPPKSRAMSDMEAMIFHFKQVMEGVKPPVGEAYVAIENPKGELGYYLVSDGTAKPVRWRIRPPSFLNLSALPRLCEGALLSDVIAINASVDIVMGEIDR